MNTEDIKKAIKEKKDIRHENNILNDVKKGSLLIFKNSNSNAKVADIDEIVKDSMGNIVEARLFANHDDGHASYHTYRYDGISHYSKLNDIASIQN